MECQVSSQLFFFTRYRVKKFDTILTTPNVDDMEFGLYNLVIERQVILFDCDYVYDRKV